MRGGDRTRAGAGTCSPGAWLGTSRRSPRTTRNSAGRGNPGTGEDYGPAPNIDHTKDWVRADLKEWLRWMKNDIGFGGGASTSSRVRRSVHRRVRRGHAAVRLRGRALGELQLQRRRTWSTTRTLTGRAPLTGARAPEGTQPRSTSPPRGFCRRRRATAVYWRLQGGATAIPSGFCGRWPTHGDVFGESRHWIHAAALALPHRAPRGGVRVHPHPPGNPHGFLRPLEGWQAHGTTFRR